MLRPSRIASSLPGSPWVIAMITAGSVRGNCARPHAVHRSSWPAARLSSAPPQRGQKRVAWCHSASPIAWKSQRRLVGRPVGERREQLAAAAPTPPCRPERRRAPRSPRSGYDVVAWRRAARRVPSGAWSGRDPLDRAVDRTQPVAGDDQHPRRRVGPAARRARRRRCAGSPPGYGHGRTGPRGGSCARVTFATLAGSVAAGEHPHRRPARRDRPHRPDARRPAAGEVDRRELPRRRPVLQRGARACTATPARGSGRRSRSRARAWASRRWRSTSTSCSATTTSQSIVRVGSCGALTEAVGVRDVIIACGACTDSSMNRISFHGFDYAPVADFGLLRRASRPREARAGGSPSTSA